MRRAPRAPLPALPGGRAGQREVLPRVRDPGGGGGVRTPPARAAVTRTRCRAPRRTPPVDGPLLRSRRLDATRAAARERGLGGLATTETVALLADLVGLPPPTRLQLSPELQRRRTIELLAQWTLAISAVQALVLLVEDLHWCDPSSLEPWGG